MQTAIFLLLSYIMFSPLMIHGQNYPTIDRVKVTPAFPTVGDSVVISYRLVFLSTSFELNSSHRINGDTLIFESCHWQNATAQSTTAPYSYGFTSLTEGKYYVKIIARLSSKEDSCAPFMSNTVIDSFVVKATPLPTFPHIDTIHLIPDNPTPMDSVRVRVQVLIGKISGKVTESSYISGDTLFISGCFTMGISDQVTYFDDTFDFGVLPAGQYYLKYSGYISKYGSHCEPIDSNFYTTSFTVGFAGIEGKTSANKTSLYPNPSSGSQLLTVTTPHAEKLDINLYDASGRMAMAVYRGTSIQGQQQFTLDLSSLSKGIYLCHVTIGQETKVLKVIRN